MPKSARKPKILKEIAFDFIKSNYFRVIRADGAFGGIAPNGSIHMGLYSERHPIPTKIVHGVVKDAESHSLLGAEITSKREVRKSIVREMEVDAVMDITQALALRQWLDDRINQYQQIVGALPGPQNIATPGAEGKPRANGKGKHK